MKENTENKRKITIADIAKLAGVSIGTVDRVLHNRGEVSEKTKTKVLEIVKKLNYRPDIMASTLARKKTMKIAIFIPEKQPDSNFWNLPIVGIKRSLNEFSYLDLQVKYFHYNQFDYDSFVNKINEVLDYKPDGILFAPGFHKESIEFLSNCQILNIPVVLINSHLEESNYLMFIGQDSFQSGYLAAKLFSLSFTTGNVLIVNISKNLATHHHILNRNNGFQNFFIKNGYYDIQVHISNLNTTDQEIINQELMKIFNSINNINGIFVPSSRVYKVAEFIRKNNIKTRIIGFDLIKENLPYLKNGEIDFIISQKPVDQGYIGLSSLIQYLFLRKEPVKNYYMPIEIITKENMDYYLSYYENYEIDEFEKIYN